MAFVDLERKFNVEYAWRSGLGVPGKDYLLLYPEDQESALEAVRKLASMGIDLCILDSLAALSPRKSRLDDTGESQMGLAARINAEWFRAALPDIHRGGMAFVYTNQFREKIGITYGDPRTKPGGKAKDHFTAVTVDMLAPELEFPPGVAADKHVGAIGIKIKGVIKKSNVSPPNAGFAVQVQWGRDGLLLNRTGEVADFGQRFGLITTRDGHPVSGSAHWYCDGALLGKTRAEAEAALRADTALRDTVEADVRSALADRKAVVVPGFFQNRSGAD